jgi:hypothetical protein
VDWRKYLPGEPSANYETSKIHADEASICTVIFLCSYRAREESGRIKTATNRMDTGNARVRQRRLHNSRVTRLCMSCTRLMNKKLQTHEFR